MFLLNEKIMKALETLKPKLAYAATNSYVFASGCSCSGNCGQSCAGGCESGCEGDCGRSCYGSNS